MKLDWKHVVVILVFSVAMAALESAVVVYLRALYYPNGFSVALKLIDEKILFVEIAREAATLIMIWAIAYLTGKRQCDKLACFLLCFAVWDIFYYVWLKVFIDWPMSFFEWDILFLIPVAWLGPVLSPVLCSLTMIVLAIVLLKSTHDIKIEMFPKILLVGGSALILYTYMYDYGNLLLENDLLPDYASLFQNKKFISLATVFHPAHYHWSIFWIGEVLIGIAIVQVFLKSKTVSVEGIFT